MTTDQLRVVVPIQITAACLLGIISVSIVLSSVPRYRSRQYLNEAIDRYDAGTEASVRAAQESLDQAVAIKPDLVLALALQGRIGLEQNDVSVARDAYGRLRQALASHELPTSMAENGIGCAILTESMRPGGGSREQFQEAYNRFTEAIKQEPGDGDTLVNAAICRLHMGGPNRLVDAAAHLARARGTANLSYDGVVNYYAALAATLAMACSQEEAVVKAVADKLGEIDSEIRTPVGMLYRSVREFDKAIELVRVEKTETDLIVQAALVKAGLLCSAPIEKSEAVKYWQDITSAISRSRNRLTPLQAQLLTVSVAIAHSRFFGRPQAAGWAQQATAGGSLSPAVSYYAGAVLLRTFSDIREMESRTRARADALQNLKAAAEHSGLPAELRFRALTDLAFLERGIGNTQEALRSAAEAAEVLKRIERPELVDKAERGVCYTNLGILLFEAGQITPALQAMGKSIELAGDSPKGIRQLADAISSPPMIADIRTFAADRLPPSTPIVSAVIRSTGPVGVRKEDVTVEIDGQRVEFIVGPNGRIYALPPRLMAEGSHALRITIAGPAGSQATASEVTFEVKYGPLKETSIGSKGG